MEKEVYQQFDKVQQQHWWFQARKEIILHFIKHKLQLSDSAAILDVGCGPGVMLNDLSQLGATWGMDMSDEALQLARKNFSGKLVKGSLPSEMPFEQGTFDLILALDIIEHIEDDVAALKALKSLLKPNGKILITVPANKSLWSKFDELNHHKRRYKYLELKRLIEKSELKICKLSYYNCLLFPLIYMKRLVNKLTNNDGAEDLKVPGQMINTILRWVFSLERYYLMRFNFPFGVSLFTLLENNNNGN